MRTTTKKLLKKKQLAKKRELPKAKKYFKEQKEKYKLPLESRGVVSESDDKEIKAYRKYIEQIYVTTSAANTTNESLLQTLRGELGQWEFLKGIMTMFNLISIPNKENPNNILIEPYADVFINDTNGTSLAARSVQHDWTDKIDISQIKLSPLAELNKRTVFKFVEDDDDYPFSVYKNAVPSSISGELGHLYGS